MTVQEFNSKFGATEELLLGFALKLTRNRDSANDLMQETAMRAYSHRERFQNGTNFKAWVTTIMRNSFINNYRRRKTRNQVEQPFEDIIPISPNVIQPEESNSIIMLKELNSLVKGLSPGHRKPFSMYYEGYSYNEIAEKMSLPIGTVKSRIFFARKQLKTKITAHYGLENIGRA